MVDRYDPMPVGYDRCTMVEDKHGDYVLYSDHAALCEAVREWDRTVRAGNEVCPCCFSEFDDRHRDKAPTCPYLNMLALANQ